MSQQQFDWYRLSLINEQKPDLQQFQKIIRSSNISSTLDKVPTSYRKKLLILFQIVSAKTKQQIKSMKSVTESLTYKKTALSDQIEHMEKGLQDSKNQLVRMKSAVVEKKKMVNKLKEKIAGLKKSKSQQTYFCPFCARNDFSSRQIFTLHMFKQHQTYKTQQFNSPNNNKLSIQNNSFTSSTNNELKDFILTLKDKEMELMRMILSQKKEMQTQELQKIYQKQMNLITMKNNSQPQYLTEKKYALSQGLEDEFYGKGQARLENDEGEIRGESQFLFYQKSEKYKKEAEKEEYSLRKALLQRKKQLNKHPYYDVFKDLEENKSLNIEPHQLEEEESERRRVTFIRDNQGEMYETTGKKDSGFKFISNVNLKSNQEILESQRRPPVQPLRMTSNNLQSQQFHPSITDRLKQEQKKQAAVNNSIYNDLGSEKLLTKGLLSQQGYVFNSGPLVDDDGGYSDWEDYFGDDNAKKQVKIGSIDSYEIKRIPTVSNNDDLTINFNISKDTHMQLPQSSNALNIIPTQHSRHQESVIEDQQIKLNPVSYSFISRQSYSKQHISQLLSPSRQSLVHNNSVLQNEQNKYSMYHNSSLNEKSSIYDLSESFSKRDIELSKDESSINLSDLKLSKLEKKRAEERLNEEKNNPTAAEKMDDYTATQGINQQLEGNRNFAKKHMDFILISEQKQLGFNQSNQQKINLLDEFQKKIFQSSPPKPLLPSNYNFQKKQAYQFNEFYRQPPIQNAEKALSPQQYFAKQNKSLQSNSKFNYKIPQTVNQIPIASQSLQSSKSSLPPKYSNKEMQKSSFGQSCRRQSELDSSRRSLQKESRGSISREKRRFRRHQDLQRGNSGLLNEFFRKQFNQTGSQGQIARSPYALDDNSEQNSELRNQSSSQFSQKSQKSLQKKSPYIRQYSQSSSAYDSSSSGQYYSESSGGVLDQFIK